MFFAWFTSICGEATENVGVFDSPALIEQEYQAMKELIILDEGDRVLKYGFHEVQVNVVFEWNGSKRVLTIVIPGKDYVIDESQDLLMVNLRTIEDEEIEFVYIVKNKFICESEGHNWMSQDEKNTLIQTPKENA